MIENFEKMENVSKKDTAKLYDLTWQKQESNLVTLYQNLTEEQKQDLENRVDQIKKENLEDNN